MKFYVSKIQFDIFQKLSKYTLYYLVFWNIQKEFKFKNKFW